MKKNIQAIATGLLLAELFAGSIASAQIKVGAGVEQRGMGAVAPLLIDASTDTKVQAGAQGNVSTKTATDSDSRTSVSASSTHEGNGSFLGNILDGINTTLHASTTVDASGEATTSTSTLGTISASAGAGFSALQDQLAALTHALVLLSERLIAFFGNGTAHLQGAVQASSTATAR